MRANTKATSARREGGTPLHEAVGKANLAMIHLLFYNGQANPFLENSHGACAGRTWCLSTVCWLCDDGSRSRARLFVGALHWIVPWIACQLGPSRWIVAEAAHCSPVGHAPGRRAAATRALGMMHSQRSGCRPVKSDDLTAPMPAALSRLHGFTARLRQAALMLRNTRSERTTQCSYFWCVCRWRPHALTTACGAWLLSVSPPCVSTLEAKRLFSTHSTHHRAASPILGLSDSIAHSSKCTAGEMAYDMAIRKGLTKAVRLFEKRAVQHAWVQVLTPRMMGMVQEWKMHWAVLLTKEPAPAPAGGPPRLRHSQLLLYDSQESLRPRESMYTDGAQMVQTSGDAQRLEWHLVRCARPLLCTAECVRRAC